MTGTLGWLAYAAAAFFGSHVLLSARPVRDTLIRAIRRPLFLFLYSGVAIAALVWLVLAYADAPPVALWPDVGWARWVPVLVLPFACVFLVAGLTAPSPTAMWNILFHLFGKAPPTSGPEPVVGIFKVTRHAVLWGVALWAGAHLVASGDAASALLFGPLLALTLLGPVLIDRKREREMGTEWAHFAGRTSILPFAAVLAGRTKVSASEIGWLRILGGLALYAALLLGHELAFGASAFPVL